MIRVIALFSYDGDHVHYRVFLHLPDGVTENQRLTALLECISLETDKHDPVFYMGHETQYCQYEVTP